MYIPSQAYATRIEAFDWQKMCLIAWLFHSEALERLTLKGSKVKLQPCILGSSLDQPPKRSLDCLVHFWSWLQTLLHGTCKWPLLVRLRSHLDRIPHVFVAGLLWQIVASFPYSQCILTWFITSLLVGLGKPNSGHVVMYTLLAVCCFQSRNCKQHIAE